MSTGFAQRLRLLALAVLAFASAGCASLLGSYDIAASGLPNSEDRLRRMLAGGQAPAAFERVQKSAPDDEMLHALYHGVLAYHAGSYADAARALDIAAHIADERMTLSVSRAALSIVTSDLALQYEPGRTERLMIPYYAALARLKLHDSEGAAVEARRLSMLLQRYDDERAPVEPALKATLRYVAGAIFEAAGEWRDADVAYRNAVALDPSLAPYRGSAGTGTVLVVLEQGFVAHRVEEGLAVMLLPEEVHAIAHGGAGDKATASAFVAGRIIDYAARNAQYAAYDDDFGRRRGGSTLHVPAPPRSLLPESLRFTNVCTTTTQAADASAADSARAVPVSSGSTAGARETKECVKQEREVDDLPYLLRVAWPTLRAEHRPQPAQLLAGAATVGFSRSADISAGVMAEFERERAALLARTIARSTAKLALTKGVERRLEEKNEAAGRLVGLIGNVGNVLLERADTRSWHLLPAGVAVARVELPAGEHELNVDVGGRRVAVGPVLVQDGSVAVVGVRAW